MARRILVLHAHPAPHKSRINRALLAAAEEVEGVTVRSLYEIYPDFLIDVTDEQRLLEAHDIVVLQHPFYWYSAPSLVKEWLDLVLEYGWGYGEGGDKLKGKILLQAVTCGGPEEAYCGAGRNAHPVRDFLLPFQQSATLCGMVYLAPFVVYGAGDLVADALIRPHSEAYAMAVVALRDGKVDLEAAAVACTLNSVLSPAIRST